MDNSDERQYPAVGDSVGDRTLPRRTLPYEALLRTVGQVIDSHDGELVRVVELVSGGFAVYYRSGEVIRTDQLSWEDLAAADMSRSFERSGTVLRPTNFCADVLRSIGADLESRNAQLVELEQQPSGIRVTFVDGISLNRETRMVSLPEPKE